MNIEGISPFDSLTSSQKTTTAVEKVERNSKEQHLSFQDLEKSLAKQPGAEILTRIKEITKDGTYSIHFEKDHDTKTMVVRLVDKDTGDIKRQIPAEELLELSARLDEWRGNIINTES